MHTHSKSGAAFQPHSRRRFLKRSASAAAALAAVKWTARSYAQVAGANEDIRIAVVGCGAMGRAQLAEIRGLAGVRVVGLCDPDQAMLDRAAVPGRRGRPETATQFKDVRKVLESKEIDAITIASPNHWHSLMVVWACQAGKDAYVEKPVCHNLWEGDQALAARTKYNRIVQAGTQWRSKAPVFEAFEWAKGGNLGKTLVSRAFCYKRRESIGKTDGPQPIPPTVDYDLWCGPSPNNGLHRENLHYDWHWFWENGNGDIGNVCCHHIDLARWALGKSTVAPTVIAVGGRMGYVDDGQTPNSLFAVHDYGDCQLIAEVRGLPAAANAGNRMDQYRGIDLGNVVECENGYVTVNERNAIAFDKDNKEIRRFTGADVKRDRSHIGNFLRVVRSRKREEQNAELAEGTTSAAISHLSNISYRLGRSADSKAIASALQKSPAGLETFERLQNHLSANNVDLAQTPLTLGVALQIDPANVRISNEPASKALTSDKYRAPFVVPAIV